MRPAVAPVLSLALAAAAPAALAQDRNPDVGPAPRGVAVQAPPSAATGAGSTAPTSGPPERDVGVEGYAPPRPCREVFSREVVRIGPATGEAEKDSFGRPVAGLDCR